VSGAVRTPAEPVAFGGVLLGVVQGHLDEVVQRCLWGVALRGEIKLRAEGNIRVVTGFNDRGEPRLSSLQDDRHPHPPANPSIAHARRDGLEDRRVQEERCATLSGRGPLSSVVVIAKQGGSATAVS
jgi:hypothetical protein